MLHLFDKSVRSAARTPRLRIPKLEFTPWRTGGTVEDLSYIRSHFDDLLDSYDSPPNSPESSEIAGAISDWLAV
jgi:hypothetical protein